jgi:hypothetical protein
MKLFTPEIFTLRSTALLSVLFFAFSATAAIPCGLTLTLTGSASSCAGRDTLRLSGASSASQIVWQSSGGSVTIDSSGGTIDTIFVPTTGGLYTAIVTDPGGCLDTSSAIVVDSTFTPSVSIATGHSHTICTGTKITFTPHPTNGGNSPSYQWYVSGAPVSTSAIFADSTLQNNDSVWVVMTSSATCLTINTAPSNHILYAVDTFVTPTIAISINTRDTICGNTQVTFFAVGTNGGSNPDYQWIANGVNVGNSPTYIATTVLNGDVYSCVITSTALCVTQAHVTSDSITFTVHPYPQVSISSTSPCSGGSVALTASGGLSYRWSTGDSIPSIRAATGTYIVTATGNYGCTASAFYNVTVHTPLRDSIVQSNDTLLLHSSGTGEFYQWYRNDSIINDATGTSYIAAQSGSYRVSVIDSAGCLSSSGLSYFTETGINTITAGPSLRIYPNPGMGRFTLECADATPQMVSITDALGRLIIGNVMVVGQHQFDLSSLTEGIYYLNASDGKTSQALKISVVK